MGKMSAPKTPEAYQYDDISGAHDKENRVNVGNQFGSNSWGYEDGRWSLNSYVDPKWQGVFDRTLSFSESKVPHFGGAGIKGSQWEGPANQMAGNYQNNKQQIQGAPAYRQFENAGMRDFGGVTPMQFREGSFQGGQGPGVGSFQQAGSNEASARSNADLFKELVPHPGEFDPMKYKGAYDEMFGSRIYGGGQRRGPQG